LNTPHTPAEAAFSPEVPPLFFCFSRSDLALPERALRRSPLGSSTGVHSPRFSLAKPARLCDIAPDSGLLAVAPVVELKAQQAGGSVGSA